MKTQSINDIMNDMTSRISGGEDLFVHEGRRYDKELVLGDQPIDITKIFIRLDPVFASLYKQYTDANSMYETLVKTNGKDDPMAEVALDQRDSAESALETRTIELKGDRDIMLRAVNELRITNEDIRILKSRKQNHQFMREQNILSRRDMKEKAKKEGEKGMYWVFWLLMLLDQTLELTRTNLNVAGQFSMASAMPEKEVACA